MATKELALERLNQGSKLNLLQMYLTNVLMTSWCIIYEGIVQSKTKINTECVQYPHPLLVTARCLIKWHVTNVKFK